MSDPTTSGGTPAAPAAAPTETAGVPPTGAFGTSRGTGLMRSKRPSQLAAKSSDAAAPAGFQPSSIEVIRPKSEYKNPFTGETSVETPAPMARVPNEPVPQAVPPAASAVVPSAVVAPTSVPTPVARVAPTLVPIPGAAPMGEMFPFAPAKSAAAELQKPRLNILPTEEARRPAQNWESPSSLREPISGKPRESRGPRSEGREQFTRHERTDDRPVFRPDRRDSPEQRDSRPDAPPRSFDSRPPTTRRESAKLDSSAPAIPLATQSGGFFSWLKGLFGGGKKPVTASMSRSDHSSQGSERDASRDDRHRHEGSGHHRRHRGGRSRHGGGERSHSGDSALRDPRGGESSAQPDGSAEGSGFGSAHSHEGQHAGERRSGGGRRRRGGRGRHSRSEGGSYPREEQGHRHSGGGSGLAPPPGS